MIYIAFFFFYRSVSLSFDSFDRLVEIFLFFSLFEFNFFFLFDFLSYLLGRSSFVICHANDLQRFYRNRVRHNQFKMLALIYLFTSRVSFHLCVPCPLSLCYSRASDGDPPYFDFNLSFSVAHIFMHRQWKNRYPKSDKWIKNKQIFIFRHSFSFWRTFCLCDSNIFLWKFYRRCDFLLLYNLVYRWTCICDWVLGKAYKIHCNNVM